MEVMLQRFITFLSTKAFHSAEYHVTWATELSEEKWKTVIDTSAKYAAEMDKFMWD